MMELDPNIALAAVVTCGVGYLMLYAGVAKSALEWKRRQRICPSCGRAVRARVCNACRAV
jgi:NADH pyrophosphatase NudC (nudix superfamily)